MLINPDAPLDKPETEQMKVIHQALRREFATLPGLIEAVAPGDAARAQLLGSHLDLLLGMLHEHHEAEDELLWPVLRQRVPLEKDLIQTMESQHEAIAESITAVGAALPVWTTSAAPDARDRLASSLVSLRERLTEHLDLEETAVLPLIHDHLTVAEWEAPKRHAVKNGPKSLNGKLMMAGMVLDGATPRERDWFLSEMPAPARVLWRWMGAGRYETYARTVRS